MKDNRIVCQDCGHETEDPDTDVPAIRCEDCHSVKVLWKTKRSVKPPGLGHGGDLPVEALFRG